MMRKTEKANVQQNKIYRLNLKTKLLSIFNANITFISRKVLLVTDQCVSNT